MKHPRIAFTGFAGTGKDTAALPLIAAGYERRCFGDLIKDLFDPLVREHLGFSAHTADRRQKHFIRPLLVHGGEVFYRTVSERFFASLPERCVNTRLMRVAEGNQWRAAGGVIIEITRPGHGCAEPMEERWLAELRAAGLIDHTVRNNGDMASLHRAVCALAGVAYSGL